MNQNQRLLNLLISRNPPAQLEDTVVIAGREVTISQEPFVRADAKAARTVLQNLRSTADTCYTTPIVKTIES